MAGLANVGAYAEAVASGAIASATFRKTYTPSTVAGTWLDLSMVAGIPAPQYYAASPLVAASLLRNSIWPAGRDRQYGR